MIDLYKGDCLEVMDELIEKGVVVDSIITDPPYGTTACKWDSIIPFDEMWLRLNKLIKPNGAIVLFGSEPFSSALRMSNIKNYKYDWIWDKKRGYGHMVCKIKPMQRVELISIFYKKQCVYNAQGLIIGEFNNNRPAKKKGKTSDLLPFKEKEISISKFSNYPVTLLSFAKDGYGKNNFHPTQKPVALMEYLIKTYTNEKEIVLDFTMGSGSTGVACKNLGRKFIGIEMDEGYFKIAEDRIDAA